VETIGSFIHKHRKASGMTMQELADQVGISKSYVHDIEHDISVPGLYISYLLSITFDCDLVEIAEFLDFVD